MLIKYIHLLKMKPNNRPMKNLVFLYLSFLCFPTATFGQNVSHFNNFQNFLESYQKDSALSAAQHLAQESTILLNMLLHDSFAQKFLTTALSPKDSVFNYELLNMMATDKNATLANSVKPLALWVKAKQSTIKHEDLKKIVEKTIEIHDKLTFGRGNKTERYALLIHQIAQQNPNCSAVADTLFSHLTNRLAGLVASQYFYSEGLYREHKIDRAYFRFLFASANFLKSNQLKILGKASEAETYLQKAAEFSPDESDRFNQAAYFYENVFLFNNTDEPVFQKLFVELLIKADRKSEATQLLIEMAKNDPFYIATLKEYYEKQQISKEPFVDYWRKVFLGERKDAFPFKLKLLDGTWFDLSQHKGKWILIDFWGTWCGPCVAELPEIQKFYEKVKSQKDLTMVTIACGDTYERVTKFMAQKKYSFPVIMSDGNVEKMYPVGGYPTKVLVTPQGKRFEIPSGVDWQSRISLYQKYY
jgi:thiol-disulfide isomerase/thioredoxin